MNQTGLECWIELFDSVCGEENDALEVFQQPQEYSNKPIPSHVVTCSFGQKDIDLIEENDSVP